MPTGDLLVAFFTAAAVFAWMPGPAMLYTAARTVARGRRAGLMASLGIHLGGYVHVIAAAAGLSAVLNAVPPLYLALKLAGAGYLMWLGARLLLGALTGTDDEAGERPVRSGRHAFIESIAVEVLNPKTALFFLAFLPQFADPLGTVPLWVQLLALGVVVNVMFSMADLACVWFAGAVVAGFRRSEVTRRWLEGAGGGVLVGLGVHLALRR